MIELGEEPEAAAEQALGGGGTAALTMALGRTSDGGKALDAKAEALLDGQTRLIALQTRHLHEQGDLQTSRLRWGRLSDRLKAMLQLMAVAVGLAAAAGVAWLAWNAHQDRSLVLEPFSTPPDLAQQGLGGQAFASLLLDRLAKMDSQAQSMRAAGSYANSWGEDAKVEIPETGVSIGELDRFLRGALGHQTRVTGEVFRRGAELTVSVRASGRPGVTVTGSDADLDGLVQRTAEAVYGQTQAYRYSKYLEYQGRNDEARTVAAQLANSGDSSSERAWAYAQLSNILPGPGQLAQGVEAGRRAVELNPRLVIGWLNRASDELGLGHDGDAARDYAHGLEAFGHAAGDLSPEAMATTRFRAAGMRDELTGDYRDAAAAWSGLYAAPDFQGSHGYALGLAAADLARGHDLEGARAAGLRAPTVRGADLLALMPTTSLPVPVFPDYEAAAATDDWPAALAVLDAADASIASAGSYANTTRANFLAPRRALALARLGRFAEAEALIGTTPADCYLCLRVRGQIAAAQQDWPAAARWFAEAVRQAPALPFAYADWGRMLLARGDPDGAIAKLTIAHGAGPHFADALELWGEALARKGDQAGAVSKFTQADREAPRWGRNHLRWGEALMLSGRYAEARAQYVAAAATDLSKPDRAALNLLLVRTASAPLHG